MRIIIITIILGFHGLIASAQEGSLVKWSFNTDGKILSNPIINDGSVYFGNKEGQFFSIDGETGELLWKVEGLGHSISEARIHAQTIYFKSGNDIFALDKENGKEIWSYQSNSLQGSGQLDLWDYYEGSPVIHGSNVYFGLGNGNLMAFDLESGEETFHYSSQEAASIKCGLIIEDSILYFADWNGKVYSIDLATGKELWIFKSYEEKLYETFGQINTQLFIDKELLFFGGRNPELQVLDKRTGRKVWSYTDLEGGWISGDPLVQDDTLFIGGSDNHKMFAFSTSNGRKIWEYEFLFNNFSKALIYKDYLLFTTGDAYTVYGPSTGRGYLYALNRSDGSIKNIALIGGNLYTSPIIEGNKIYFGSEDGYLYAIDIDHFINDPTKLTKKGYLAFDFLKLSPTPFTDNLTIEYRVNYSAPVKISIKDIAGNQLVRIADEIMDKGDYKLSWTGKDASGESIPPGYYFVEIGSTDYFKMALVQKK